MTRFFKLLAIIALGVSGTISAAIFDIDGKPIPIGKLASSKISWRAVEKKDELSGVGILAYPYGSKRIDLCTLFLVDTGKPAGPAYLITNAHCTLHILSNPLTPDEVRINQKTEFVATFNRLKGVSDRVVFKLKEISYYTEFGTDLAIFKATKSLREFIEKGIRPLTLAKEKAKPGTLLSLAGAPLQRVPDTQHYLHTSDCELRGEVALKNGEYFAPHSAIHQCSSIEGFSGSPLIDRKTREVRLLNSHGAAGDSSDPKCKYASQPCEVDKLGKETVEIFHNYAQSLHSVAGCFDSNGVLDLEQSTCQLPKRN